MNYPNGIKKREELKNDVKISHKNRGMTLEYELNITNEYYREIDKAYIYKKPTPIKIVKVDYPSRDKTVIKEAYFTIPSTTDYNGLYHGKYIDFEAKETQSRTSFAITNIHPHQIEHLKNINRHEGIAFLIIRFTVLGETYLLTISKFLEYLEKTNKKSIPIDFFREEAYLIKDGYRPRVDYLKIVDELMGGKNNAKE